MKQQQYIQYPILLSVLHNSSKFIKYLSFKYFIDNDKVTATRHAVTWGKNDILIPACCTNQGRFLPRNRPRYFNMGLLITLELICWILLISPRISLLDEMLSYHSLVECAVLCLQASDCVYAPSTKTCTHVSTGPSNFLEGQFILESDGGEKGMLMLN